MISYPWQIWQVLYLSENYGEKTKVNHLKSIICPNASNIHCGCGNKVQPIIKPAVNDTKNVAITVFFIHVFSWSRGWDSNPHKKVLQTFP